MDCTSGPPERCAGSDGALTGELHPCLELLDPAFERGPLAAAFLEALPPGGPTVAWLSETNRLVNQKVKYVVREEQGIWTPVEILQQGDRANKPRFLV